MSVRAPAGSIGKTEYDAVIGRGVAAIKGNEFIFQTLLKMEIHGYWKNISCGSTFESLNSDDIKNAILSLPSSLEQTKIGKLFSNIDTLIEKEEVKYNKLLDIKKSLLNKMFPIVNNYIPSIRFNGFDTAWEFRELVEIGRIETGNTPSTSLPEYYCEKGMPWVTPTDIKGLTIKKTAKNLSELGIKVARVVPKDSILVTSIASIGKNCIVEQESAFNQQINAVVPGKKYYPYFIFTQSELWSNTMAIIASSGGMKMVSKSLFSELKFPFPSLPEQTKIGKLFNSLDNLIDLSKSKTLKLKTVKQSLLKAMFV